MADKDINNKRSYSKKNSRIFAFLLSVFLIITLVGFLPFSPRNTLIDVESGGEGSLVRQLLYILLFALSMLFFALSRKKLSIVSLPLPIIMLFIWSMATLLWSAVPDIAFRRLVLAFIVCSTLYNLVFSLGIEKAFKVMMFVLIGLTLLSFFSGLIIPAAIHQPNDREFAVIGDWRGIFVHKNNAGLIAALAFMLAFNHFLATKLKVWGTITLLTALMLLLTGSKTSLILCIPSLSLGFFMRHYVLMKQKNIKMLFAGIIGLVSLVIVCLIALNWQLAEDTLSDPTAFTGRAGIWSVMIKVISDNPLFGQGYGSLFSVGNTSPLAKYTTDYAFEWVMGIAHAHNGYIEMIASIGFIGFGLGIFAFLIKPLKLFFRLPSQYIAPYIVPIISMLFFMVCHNSFETSLFNGSRQGWIIWFFVVSFIYSFNKHIKAMQKQSFSN